MCLRKEHISRNCPSKSKCHNSGGRHHVSICQANASSASLTYPAPPVPASVSGQQCLAVQSVNDTVVCYSNSATPVFFQTAQAMVYNAQQPQCKVRARIILDSGSQRTYMT